MASNSSSKPNYYRPRAYQNKVYTWNFLKRKVRYSQEAGCNEIENAVFVVHGMGKQLWAETASVLRSGVEDVLEHLFKGKRESQSLSEQLISHPPPFIQEGYWGNYDNFRETFKGVAKRLTDNQITFFENLFTRRTHGLMTTVAWLLKYQFALILPRKVKNRKWYAWLIYVLFQIPAIVALPVVLIKARKVLTEVIADVRLYVSPKGIIERTIVQHIDRRIGSMYLRMLGLNWKFNPLPKERRIQRDGSPVVFKHIVWVSHSLGSVISYNVLSDLLFRSHEMLKSESTTKVQRSGIIRFQESLKAFVTIGSPLDKLAYLFGENTLRNWPMTGSSESSEPGYYPPWYNFYHVLDPVSGGLDHPLITNARFDLPVNIHSGRFWRLPFFAHTSYWSDRRVIRFVLSRVYEDICWDEYDGKLKRTAYKFASVLIWFITAVVLIAAAGGFVWYAWTKWLPPLLKIF